MMNVHSSWLLSVGSFADRALPAVLTMQSCGAALSAEHLHIFRILRQQAEEDSLPSFASQLSACRDLLSREGASAFPGLSCSVDSCVPSLPDLQHLPNDSGTPQLIAALRGKGIPLSFRTDSEAVEWAFSDLMSHASDASVEPLRRWLSGIRSDLQKGNSVRLALLADPADPFAGGIALFLLHDLRILFPETSVFISFLAIAETASPLPSSFRGNCASFLKAMEERDLLRVSAEAAPHGADALWFLSLPSSMVESPDAHLITAAAAGRILGRFFSEEALPDYGYHFHEIDGTLSLSSLQSETVPFAAFLRTAVWALYDLFPSLRNFLGHPARLRSISPNSRGALFKRLFSSSAADPALSRDLSLLEKTFRLLISQILSFLRAVPSSLRLSSETAALWQQAIDACGRTVTVASEHDVAVAEAHESGLDAVRPVHRDSLADTDEEQLLHRLDDIRKQLENEISLRDQSFHALGGFRSLQVQLDCLNRCRAALSDARKKAEQNADIPDHLTILRRERRIRLLEAAVARCESELTPARVEASVSLLPNTVTLLPDPYAGEFLSPAACHALEGQQDQIPPLFPGLSLAEPRSILKTAFLPLREHPPAHPLPSLLLRAYDAFLKELSACSFLSGEAMPPVPLLPDLMPVSRPESIRDLLSLLASSDPSDADSPECRGILAMLLLRQYRRPAADEALLSGTCLSSDDSPVLCYWLSCRRADRVHILSLSNHELSVPFLLILPGSSLIPAYRGIRRASLVPSFVTWYDRESDCFRDPCKDLGEGDRKLLAERLQSFLSGFPPADQPSSLYAFLSGFLQDLLLPSDPQDPDTALKTRLRAACGLIDLPAYRQILRKVAVPYEHSLASDLLGSCLTGREDFPAYSCMEIPEDVLYFWRDTPFARESSRLILESSHAPGEDYALSRLGEECAVLSDSSDDYRDTLLRNLQACLNRYPDALPEHRSQARTLLEQAQKPLSSRDASFTWPWDPLSPSVQTVLCESLGDELSRAALRPFSDLLTVFPARGGEIIGDSLFSALCILNAQEDADRMQDPNQPAVQRDAFLPPLSPEFARSLCTLEEGRILLQPGFLRLDRIREDAFRLVLSLNGVFPVHLIREYSPEEVLYLYAHEIPTVAVWPSVPFRPEDWHAYYVYAHLSEKDSMSVFPEGSDETALPLISDRRFVGVYDSFPVCFSFFRDNRPAGVLPNLLPRPDRPLSGSVTVCMDFGSSGTSVVFTDGLRPRPMQGPVMVRTLLNNPASSRDLLRREFLPAVPVSALLPTVSRIFRNVPGASPVPFSDGIILMSADLEDLLTTPSDAIYTSLKWEEEKGRSGFLCLHQVMLMAALQARSEGAFSLFWRFSLPDEMAREGRENLMNLLRSLAEQVYLESGFPVPENVPPVSFASDSAALGAYFRFCAPEDTRGGFMVLDLGACTADISLFLRGREQAVRTCQIPLGVQYMLLPSLLRDPELLLREFGNIPNGVFQRDLGLFSRSLAAARTDPVALRRARVSLDYFLSDHWPALITAVTHLAASGIPTRFGSLLFLHFSYLMMLSGLVLLQICADPGKNDFLPEQMSLCLSGRGSILMETLPPRLKTSLWHFLTMFRNQRVASLSLLFSAEKKMEIPVGLSLLNETSPGLPPASSVPASIAVRPEELLPEFLLRFRREFPASAELLFPGFYSGDYYHPLSEHGEALISSAISQSFPVRETPRPYDSLSAWIGNLLDLLQ
ncbi:MAG: hypothetical protein IKQ45_06565 [Clostridia bacterium]|nr:hypothetical protein [Clostridia bacterium]